MHKVTLSNHHDIYGINPGEPEIIYSQIDEYFHPSIQINDSAIVFDIGANIGLFSLVTSDWGARPLTIYAFEPIPALFAALKANIDHYGLQDRVTPLRYGVAEQRGEIDFIYYPNSTAFSTAFPSDDVADHIQQHFHDTWTLPVWQRWIGQLFPKARDFLVDRRVKKKFAGEHVVCPTISISEIIREYDVAQIDLLKVDAENAELSILNGISEPDWPRIRQIVMEVHAVDKTLDTVQHTLAAHGFDRVIVEQDADMTSLNNAILYATRSR